MFIIQINEISRTFLAGIIQYKDTYHKQKVKILSTIDLLRADKIIFSYTVFVSSRLIVHVAKFRCFEHELEALGDVLVFNESNSF